MRTLTSMAILFVILSLVPAAATVSADAPSSQGYLPYRVAIAPGVEIADPPQPFDRAVHGPPIPNTQPYANVAGRPDVTLPLRPLTLRTSPSSESVPAEEPGSGDRGLWLTGGEGIYAGNDAQTNLSIPDAAIGTTIYAPTHMSPGSSCIETVTAHWRYSGMAATAHGHGFWDWCVSDGTGGWQVFEFMDSTWISRYVRRSNGEFRYWTQVYSDAPLSWKGLLYNFLEGRWEEKTAISGTNVTGFGTTGWTMWESHYLMDQAQLCPPLPDIRANDLRLFMSGKWTKLTTSTSQNTLGPYGLCWADGTYTFRVWPKLDAWIARTP